MGCFLHSFWTAEIHCLRSGGTWWYLWVPILAPGWNYLGHSPPPPNRKNDERERGEAPTSSPPNDEYEEERKEAGSRGRRCGKTYWAQKHMDMGRGKWQPKRLGKSEADLISNAPSTKDKRIFSNEDAKDAMKSAWRNTIKWYRDQCKLKYEGKGART